MVCICFELSTAERAEVKKIARELLNRHKQLHVLNWRQKSSVHSLPAPTTARPMPKSAAIFEHIDAGVYAAVG